VKQRIISHLGKENFAFYEKIYGIIDYQDKTVLDLGADVGSTADYFLQKGALVVFAVEADVVRFAQLKTNIRAILKDPQFETVKPTYATVDNAELLAGYFFLMRPDVVKYDLDAPGGKYFERLLLELPENCLRLVPEYLVEIHTRPMARKLFDYFKIYGFKLVKDNLWAYPNTSVAYFKRIDVDPLEVAASKLA